MSKHGGGHQFLARLYGITGRAIAVTTALVLVKVFKRLYLLNFCMEIVQTCHGFRKKKIC